MLIRYAEFVGTIQAGKEDEFYSFVEKTLTPLWAKFDGAVSVAVCRELERDEGAAVHALLLAITYPDQAALDISSPATHASSRANRHNNC